MSEIYSGNILKMNEDKTMEFITLYENEECLWNTTSKNFRNKLERSRAAQRIAQALNIPNFEAKHVLIKFKNLRNGYCQELRKMAASVELGGVYVPKVIWFKKMDSFLRPHLSKTNIGQVVDNNDAILVVVPKTKDDDWNGSVDSEAGRDNDSEDGNTSFSTTRSELVSKVKRPRLDVETDPLLPTDNSNDYYDDFGRYIAALLRTLPPKKALALQPEIVKLITNAALPYTE